MFNHVFNGRTVWLSGHTGFKGAWLAHWLLELGAEVHGFALAPATKPALFNQLGLAKRLRHQVSDLRDARAVAKSIHAAKPDFVFHLGAQALVRLSYAEPVETYATNLMGTIHVMEAMRSLKKPCAAVLITTDKCYENREWERGYRETDMLGGYDPYSSSKATAEIAIAAWRRSFFADHPVRFASARAGNVIGGGDWALDRIVPDCVRALQKGQPISVRNPKSTRPWQHVLEPLSGYLWLAAKLAENGKNTHELASPFNFGPGPDGNHTVKELVEEVLRHWPGRWKHKGEKGAVHEARLLQLSIDKARAELGWFPAWDFSTAVGQTITWYRDTNAGTHSPAFLASQQINAYSIAAMRARAPWSKER